MERFVIEGGVPLNGTVMPSGNKNAALPILAATLLTDRPVTLHNLPNIGDVRIMLEILEDLGASVERHGNHSVTIQVGKARSSPDPRLFGEIRGSMTLLGPLLARTGRVELSLPGGDRIGRRRIDTHLLAMGALGARVKHNDRLAIEGPVLRGTDVWLDEASVTGTENAVMAACLARGETVIRNAASEPHVQELCHFLRSMGAEIEGIGSNVLRIQGKERLEGGECTIGPDFMEVGSLIGLAAVTGGEILIKNAARLDPVRAPAWLRTVARHEALAIRAQRSDGVARDDLDPDRHVATELTSTEEQVDRGDEEIPDEWAQLAVSCS